MNKRIISKEEYSKFLSQGIQVGNCFVYMGHGNWAFATQEVKMVSVPIGNYGYNYYEPVKIFRTRYGIGGGGGTEDGVIVYNRSAAPSLLQGGIPASKIDIKPDFARSDYKEQYDRLQTSEVYRLLMEILPTSTFVSQVSFSTDTTEFRPREVGVLLYDRNVSPKSLKTYYHPSPNKNRPQNEMGRVNTLLHEAVHIYFHTAGGRVIDPDTHNTFPRMLVYRGMKEYNDTYNLGYSDEDLEFLSFRGLDNSDEFKQWISERVLIKRSQGKVTTEEEEIKAFHDRVSRLTYLPVKNE